VLVPTQAVEVTGVVVVGAVVHVPVGVDGVGRGHGVASMVAILLKLKRMVEAMVAMKCIVSILFTDLASGLAAATATALATMTKATTGGRCTARVSRLVTGNVGRGLDVADRVVALDAHLRTHQMGEGVVQTNRVITRGDGGDQGLILGPKTGQHVAENFLICKRMAERYHGVDVAFHLLKINSSSHACLLGVGELIAHLHDLGTIL
jgi:hypothetical protein